MGCNAALVARHTPNQSRLNSSRTSVSRASTSSSTNCHVKIQKASENPMMQMAIPLWTPKVELRNNSIVESDECMDKIYGKELKPLKFDDLQNNDTVLMHDNASEAKCVSLSLASERSGRSG